MTTKYAPGSEAEKPLWRSVLHDGKIQGNHTMRGDHPLGLTIDTNVGPVRVYADLDEGGEPILKVETCAVPQREPGVWDPRPGGGWIPRGDSSLPAVCILCDETGVDETHDCGRYHD